MNPLEVRNVVKGFRQGEREVRALDGVSLTVGAGTFTAIMGQSGSGKSTLLHLAGGLTQPDEGEVLVAGDDLAVMNDRQLTLHRRRNIGLIFQSFNLIPTLTAVENVALPLKLDGERNGSADLALSLLNDLQLGGRAGHRPDAMSGGEQQRVAVARALVAQPALILADEPTGNLDSVNGDIVCNLLRRLVRDDGKTIVMVTHEPHVAVFADRVVILKDGRIIGDFETGGADATEVAHRYQEIVA